MAVTNILGRQMNKHDTSSVKTKDIGKAVDEIDQSFKDRRRTFERRWYDNNFFDDGKHYRFLSRVTGKIVDLESQSKVFLPRRSIPKASRQIRGMANVLLSLEPVPIVYPERITRINYPDIQEYNLAYAEAKVIAQKAGHWIKEEWKNQDMNIKLALMAILTMKHGISFLQVWPDAIEEKINTKVYDAFDIRLNGSLTEISDSPAIIKAVPRTIREIKADEKFEEAQVAKLNPDNKQASSELKEAYLLARHGGHSKPEGAVSVVQKEAFIKEFLNEDNWSKAVNDMGEEGGMEGKSRGDVILRQVFSAGGIWLRDKYTPLPDYPFVDFRLEPGPIYQTSQIERFIPQNKSLDAIVSRIESFVHTMTVGVYQNRKGEVFDINNKSGAQVIEYENTPLDQMNLAGLPAHVFAFVNMINEYIEEQGVTTTASGKLPKGVKAHAAIESLKASEITNMGIAINMLKKTTREICEKFMDIADHHFVSPQTVMRLEKGEPDYYDVIGGRGVELREKIGEQAAIEGAIPLKKEYRVDVNVESGTAHTELGRREATLELTNFMIELANNGWLNAEAVKEVLRAVLETFKFGGTAEIMEAFDSQAAQGPISDQQKEEMKVAFLEVIRDLQQNQQNQGGQDGQG